MARSRWNLKIRGGDNGDKDLGGNTRDYQSSESILCAGCGHDIKDSEEWFRVFLVPGPNADYTNEGKTKGVHVGMGGAPKPNGGVSFSDLPSRLKWKFRVAGLGNGRGIRNLAEGEEFYRKSLPRGLRSLRVEDVDEFLRGKVASHKESVANVPGKAKMPGNIIWENRGPNLKRGSANMRFGERLHAHAINGTHNLRIVGQYALRNAGKAGVFAALTELPVSAIEGTIHVAKGKRSKKSAVREAAINTAKAGITGGVVAGALTVGTALFAVPAVAAAYPVLVPVGVALYGNQVYRRISRAAQDPPIPQPIPLYFHASCTECGEESDCQKAFFGCAD